MDALERVQRIRPGVAVGPWTRDQFLQAAALGKQRWSEVEALFDIQYPIFQDAVAAIAPEFRLTVEEKSSARSAEIPGQRNVDSRIALWFVKWERCPATAGLPNPYEPWIEIWEHGGAFSVEHGLFVDVYDAEGMPTGAVVVRRA